MVVYLFFVLKVESGLCCPRKNQVVGVNFILHELVECLFVLEPFEVLLDLSVSEVQQLIIDF